MRDNYTLSVYTSIVELSKSHSIIQENIIRVVKCLLFIYFFDNINTTNLTVLKYYFGFLTYLYKMYWVSYTKIRRPRYDTYLTLIIESS